MEIRPCRREDAAVIAQLFTESVHAIGTDAYSPEQLAAWAPDPPDIEYWQRQLDSHIAFLAEQDSHPAGFITFELDGHLDHLYVESEFQRRGVASALCRHMERYALAHSIDRIFTEASIPARLFFASIGFRATGIQTVECRGSSFLNYCMEKLLVSGR